MLAGLNGPQRQAVVHEGSPLLIVAGAGSGKTRVLAHRIAYLLGARGVQPGEVLAITFTNKAAGEMKERVAALVGPRARAMWVSTFHSMCVRILRAEAGKLGMKSSFTIYDQGDSVRLMTMVARDLDLDAKRYPGRGLAAQVSNLKNELIDEESYVPSTAPEKVLAEAYTLYQQRLRQAHAMDFDDLIMTRCTCCRPSRRRRALPPPASGTCWSTSTRTPTTPSTCWSASWSARGGAGAAGRAVRRR
jgi:DNA helicase-2/ATP-dependent DNA helicase PcrA